MLLCEYFCWGHEYRLVSGLKREVHSNCGNYGFMWLRFDEFEAYPLWLQKTLLNLIDDLATRGGQAAGQIVNYQQGEFIVPVVAKAEAGKRTMVAYEMMQKFARELKEQGRVRNHTTAVLIARISNSLM